MFKDTKASSAQELNSSRLAGPWILPHHGIHPGDTVASAIHAELLRKYAKHNPGKTGESSLTVHARLAAIEFELMSTYVLHLSASGYSDASHGDDSAQSAAFPPPVSDANSAPARTIAGAIEELTVLRTRMELGSPGADAAAALRVFAYFALGRDADVVADAHSTNVLRVEPKHGDTAAHLHAAHIVMAAALTGLAAERCGAVDVALDAYERGAKVYEGQQRVAVGIDELERWGEVVLYRSALLRTRLGRDAAGALHRYQAAEVHWPSSFRAPQRSAVSTAYLGALNRSFMSAVLPPQAQGETQTAGGLLVRTVSFRRGRPNVVPRASTKRVAQAKQTIARALELEDKFPRAGETNSNAERMAEDIVHAWRYDGALGGDTADEVAYVLYRLATVTFRSQRILRLLVEVLYAAEAYAEASAALDQYVVLVERSWETSGMPDETGHAAGVPVDSPAEFVDTLLRGAHIALTYLHNPDSAEKLARTLLRLVGREKSEGTVVDAPAPIVAQILRCSARVALVRALTAAPPTRRAELVSACEQLHESATLDPDATETHYCLAIAKAQLRDTRGALTAARRALELEPASLETWHLLVLLVSAEKDYSGALALADEALSQAETDEAEDADGQSARTYLASFDYPPSVRERSEAYVQLLVTHNALTELTEGAAAALEEQKEVFEAFQARLVTRATPATAVPASSVAPGELAATPAAARVSFRVARETRLLVDLWLMSAATFRRAGNLEQARCAINEAERLDATHAAVWVQMAQWCSASEQSGATVTCLYKALACDGENVPARIHLARYFLEPNALSLRQSHADAIAAARSMSGDDVLEGTLVDPESAARRAGSRALGAADQPRLGEVAAPFAWDTDPNPAARGLAEVLLRTTTQYRGWDVPEAWHLLAQVERGRSNAAARAALLEALALEESRPVRVIRDALVFP